MLGHMQWMWLYKWMRNVDLFFFPEKGVVLFSKSVDNCWERNWLQQLRYLQPWFVILSHVIPGMSIRLAVKAPHTSVAAPFGRYSCCCGSGFIKGVAISTRCFVALKICLLSSVSPPKTHCDRAAHDLDRENWQPRLTPGLWSAISTSKLNSHFITSHTSISVTRRCLTVSIREL